MVLRSVLKRDLDPRSGISTRDRDGIEKMRLRMRTGPELKKSTRGRDGVEKNRLRIRTGPELQTHPFYKQVLSLGVVKNFHLYKDLLVFRVAVFHGGPY